MTRLLGISAEHSSHLHEIRAAESAGALKLIESLGSSLTRLAVAHTVYLSRQVCSAGDASRRTAAAIGPLYDRLAQYFCLASRTRFGASVRDDRSQPAPAVLRTITGQVMGAYAICAGYVSLQRLVDEHLDKLQEEGRPEYEFKTALQAYSHSINRGQPRYTLLAEKGPEHAKTFSAQVITHDGFSASGVGKTKKLAEQDAAQQYLSRYAPRFIDGYFPLLQERSGLRTPQPER